MECKTGVFKIGTEDSRGEFPESEGKRAQCQRPTKEWEDWKAEWGDSELKQEEGVQDSTFYPRSNRQLPTDNPCISLLRFQWRTTHSSFWTAQMLASKLSLIAFVLLLVMIFSKKWLHLSGIRYYQRWPMNVSDRIYTSALIVSMGLLHICRSKSCSNLENEKVTCIFSTLLLFPVNLWIFELEGNISIPIGWSYFIGWLVFVLYVTCAILCHFNHKSFWSLILNRSSGTVFCSSNAISIEESPSEQTITGSSRTQEEEVLGHEQKNTHP
ncbi:outer dense fiber protein 4 [Lemur catta]|uniref:outer dense fiber protein 4 n=1 Tax=Lemur catta TaxID=9447 RepID=UPI001E269958|nr:outer dense fiber protein 4 [Lemur catta]